MTTTDWKQDLAKQAGTQEAPKDAVAEAFAQQAYSAIENRTGPLMHDPYLLGFEIVDRNERNNRLIGAFAFRAGRELVLAPVFFLNGNIKGQCLLYRKTKDQFVPNNKTQVRAILAKADTGEQGHSVDPRSARQATMEFDTRALAEPYKRASAAGAENRELIMDLWKSACACAAGHKDVPTRPLFKQFLVDHPDFQEKAASLVKTDHSFAESLVVSRALEADVNVKEAAAPAVPKLRLITDIPENDVELFKSASDSLFKRGYAIEDNRPQERLMEAFVEGRTDEYLRTTPHHPIDWVIDHNHEPVKVLVAPEAGSGRSARYIMLALEGKAKGSYKRYRDEVKAVFTDDKIVNSSEDLSEELAKLGDDKPKAGGKYLLFSVSRGKYHSYGSFNVKKVDTDGDVTTVHYGYGDAKLIQRADLEETLEADLHRDYGKIPVMGSDVRWIKLPSKDKKEISDAGDPVDDCCDPPSNLTPLDPDDLWNMVIRKSARAEVKMGKSAGQVYARANGRTVQLASPKISAMKLASLGLTVDDAHEITDRVFAGEEITFLITPPIDKIAHTWYEREPDMENDFVSTGFDSDLQIPIDDMSGVPVFYPTRTSSPTREASNWLDARDPGPKGYSPEDHIDDEDLFAMTNPAQQLSQLAATSGMDHLIDHGALGSLVKTFDAVALATSFLDDLEKGVDRLGRIVFLILWKPNDFSERFGEDDLPDLENSLVAAFEKHGDLVLDLRQRSGDD